MIACRGQKRNPQGRQSDHAEKITFGVAIAGALGVGALLKSWVDHLLARGEKKITVADKSVQMMDTLMTRMGDELTRVHAALTKAQQESEELRAELAKHKSLRGDASAPLFNAARALLLALAELAASQRNIDDIHGKWLELSSEYLSTGVDLRRLRRISIPTGLKEVHVLSEAGLWPDSPGKPEGLNDAEPNPQP